MTPLATTLPEISGRIKAAKAKVTLGLLNNLWAEFESRLGNLLPLSSFLH
jgi:hypothetical protein